MFTVYALYSPAFDKIYVGFTSNLEQRLLSHNVNKFNFCLDREACFERPIIFFYAFTKIKCNFLILYI
ncbi:GIY-YIG nuclease family protein [Indibacter alkaliphilus]|uniref:GIY-YIG nuclease family protein n=1 Tax=Indibacter alkaliphilus TaxID=579922 RepID=UPI000A014075|nr:GIY-YIG nuclease family protein [Indibacter alkaliphilus]